jgi:hypothetical protein
MPRRLWDRLPAETDEAYARFLIYRNLGIGRSFRRAYRHYLRECDGYTGGLERLHVPGSWRKDARAYFWAERAAAWDVRNLAAYGAKVAALHARAVEKVAKKNLRHAGTLTPADEAWPALMASLKVVQAFLSPEVVKGVQDRFQPARPAAPAPAGGPPADPDE